MQSTQLQSIQPIRELSSIGYSLVTLHLGTENDSVGNHKLEGSLKQSAKDIGHKCMFCDENMRSVNQPKKRTIEILF